MDAHVLTNISLFSHLIIYAFILSHSHSNPPIPRLLSRPIPQLLTRRVRVCVFLFVRRTASRRLGKEPSRTSSALPCQIRFHQECLPQAVPKHDASKTSCSPVNHLNCSSRLPRPVVRSGSTHKYRKLATAKPRQEHVAIWPPCLSALSGLWWEVGSHAGVFETNTTQRKDRLT